MRKIFFYLLFAGVTIFYLACKQANSDQDLSLFNKDSLTQHIKMLASDSFQGRKPFSIGETKAVDYIQNTFKNLGLEPGNGNSYIQDVPLVEITPNPDAVMKVQSPKGNFDLQKTTDFVISTNKTDSLISLKNDELIFAGYGVVAPEYNWNDYAGIDVKGKVVLVLVNDPGFGVDTTIFKGNTMTYYGRWTYKYEEAARQGAKACLIIHNTAAASYPFNVVQNSWGSSNLYLDEKGSKEPHLALQGWVSADAAKKIFAAAGKDTSLILSANKNTFKAVSLNEKLSLNVKVKSTFNLSHNVIAKITGTKRPDEYVIYTAHWDHFGIGKKDEKGDSIYNGAIDNASGTAALLEMARVFKESKNKPERTIVFLSVTAEEQGLLGSAYYAAHPVYPLNKTVADINMDGINAFEKTNDITITGAGQNDLEDYVTEFGKAQGRYIAPEAHPEAGHYYRSDHFSFAKVGVPALDCSGGIDVVGKGKEYGKKLEDDYTANRYHRPADEFDPKWTFEGGLQDMQLLFLVGKKLANETSWPQWKTGSEFKAIRDKSK
ncbi:bacterial leucyl aminopeptidase precursor [mine drainage metagenome]|uniref:Bacterial leucyl aminopeptidase n=1 Tax=mine drainage metagenome TaxID=410659 RepID=A0A1J5QYL4_9ZZZZ